MRFEVGWVTTSHRFFRGQSFPGSQWKTGKLHNVERYNIAKWSPSFIHGRKKTSLVTMFQTWNWKNGNVFSFVVAFYMATHFDGWRCWKNNEKKTLDGLVCFNKKRSIGAFFFRAPSCFVGTCIKGERLTGKMLAIAKQQRECPPATKNVYWRAEGKLSPITSWIEWVSIVNNQLLLSRGSCCWEDFFNVLLPPGTSSLLSFVWFGQSFSTPSFVLWLLRKEWQPTYVNFCRILEDSPIKKLVSAPQLLSIKTGSRRS